MFAGMLRIKAKKSTESAYPELKNNKCDASTCIHALMPPSRLVVWFSFMGADLSNGTSANGPSSNRLDEREGSRVLVVNLSIFGRSNQLGVHQLGKKGRNLIA